MKVEIIGNVSDSKGRLTGVVDLPGPEAKRLIELKVAKPAGKTSSNNTDKSNGDSQDAE